MKKMAHVGLCKLKVVGPTYQYPIQYQYFAQYG